MSVHFHPITVKEITKETADCVSVAFEIPDHLKSGFQYMPGQYLNLRAVIEGEDQRRSYSLCSSPLTNEWRIAVKKVQGGVFSTFMNEQLQVGDRIEATPPMGKFTLPLDPTHSRHYVAIAAGSGITPVLSIISSVLMVEKNSSITLVYGNRNRHSIIFKEQLEDLKNKYLDRFQVVHVLSREITDATINTGRIDHEKCKVLFTNLLDLKADAFLICGPVDMMLCIKGFLLSKGIAQEKIHVELFSSPDDQPREIRPHTKAVNDELESDVTIRFDGATIRFPLAFDSDNILDAALHQGADLPYSCKAGVCSTCRAKLLEGKVEMEANYALEPDDVANGFILTCQSHPTTSTIIIDFDAK